MLLLIVLTLLTLTSAATCPINPTNPACPIWLHSNITSARFDVTQSQAFTASLSGGEPLIALSNNVNVYFGEGGNLNVYDSTGTPFSTFLPAPLHDCNKSVCRLQWQTDGNLVIYIDGVAVWQAGTGGRGKVLTFASPEPVVSITDATGALLWSTPASGQVGSSSAPDVCSGFGCLGSMCSGCLVCWPSVEKCYS